MSFLPATEIQIPIYFLPSKDAYIPRHLYVKHLILITNDISLIYPSYLQSIKQAGQDNKDVS